VRAIERGTSIRTVVTLFFAVCAAAAFTSAHAQGASYPTRPVRLLLPFAAGGTVDIMTRPIAAKLHESLGRPVIVDNRPSAGGVLAAELTAQAAPDGYTLFMASTSALFIAPAYFRKVGYDTLRDFTPISLVAQQPLIIVANPSLPVRNVKELVALAKARPGKLNYGTVGLGTSNHLTGELLSHAAGIKMEPVAYKGGAQGIAAAMGGEIELMVTQPNTALPFVKSGRVRAIATTGARRSPVYPEVETLVEAGYPRLNITGYYALVGPAGLPRPILERLNAEVRRAVGGPDVRDILVREGTEPVTTTPGELAALMKKEIASWSAAMQLTGIKEK